MVSVGDKITFQGKVHEILHIYKSGYMEVKEGQYMVKLIHISEIKSN
ncbi:hypothetical protein [Metabacillus idriensis]